MESQAKFRRDLARKIDLEALEAFEAGEGTLADVLNLDPSDIRSLRERGVRLLSRGEAEGCRQIFQILEALGDRTAEGAIVMAMCHARLGERIAALRYFERGLSSAKENGDRLLSTLLERWRAQLVAMSSRSE